ncbi:hypothetical protein [Paracoccus mutanolyticus]
MAGAGFNGPSVLNLFLQAAMKKGPGGPGPDLSTFCRDSREPAGPSSDLIAEKAVYLVLGIILGPAVAFLQLARELVASAGHLGQFVIGQVAPLFLDRALELVPLALDDISAMAVPFVPRMPQIENGLAPSIPEG